MIMDPGGISLDWLSPSNLMHSWRDIVLKLVDSPHVSSSLLRVNQRPKTESIQTETLTIASIFRLSSSAKCVLITCPSRAQEFPYLIMASSKCWWLSKKTASLALCRASSNKNRRESLVVIAITTRWSDDLFFPRRRRAKRLKKL